MTGGVERTDVPVYIRETGGGDGANGTRVTLLYRKTQVNCVKKAVGM